MGGESGWRVSEEKDFACLVWSERSLYIRGGLERGLSPKSSLEGFLVGIFSE